jgi:hypothetical protein
VTGRLLALGHARVRFVHASNTPRIQNCTGDA